MMLSMISVSSNHNRNINGTEDKGNPLTVNSCGYHKFVTKNYGIARLNGRIDYQLIYMLNGKGYFKLDNQMQEIPKGNIVIYKPGEPQIYEYRFNDSAEVYWVHFTGYAVPNLLAELELSDKPARYVDVSGDYVEIFKKIIHELNMKNLRYEYFSASYLLELFSRISRDLSKTAHKGGALSDSDINDVIKMMHIRHNQKCLVADFAKICNLSVYRFIHKFKNHTGKTPIEYITKIRIDEARYLLCNSLLSISEIASVVGYEDPLYFSRMYKKATGLSPSNYRAKFAPTLSM